MPEGMISPYSAAWRLHAESEARFLGASVRLPESAPYWRPEVGAEEVGPAGERVYGFRLCLGEGRVVTIDGVNVDCRSSLEDPDVFLRFTDGETCWVAVANVELPLDSAPRERLSPLAVDA